jgi:hypothetical protein
MISLVPCLVQSGAFHERTFSSARAFKLILPHLQPSPQLQPAHNAATEQITQQRQKKRFNDIVKRDRQLASPWTSQVQSAQTVQSDMIDEGASSKEKDDFGKKLPGNLMC